MILQPFLQANVDFFGNFSAVNRYTGKHLAAQADMITMRMRDEKGIAIWLTRCQSLDFKILIRIDRNIARQLRAQVDEYPRVIRLDFGNTTAYLVRPSVYRYLHCSLISISSVRSVACHAIT